MKKSAKAAIFLIFLTPPNLGCSPRVDPQKDSGSSVDVRLFHGSHGNSKFYFSEDGEKVWSMLVGDPLDIGDFREFKWEKDKWVSPYREGYYRLRFRDDSFEFSSSDDLSNDSGQWLRVELQPQESSTVMTECHYEVSNCDYMHKKINTFILSDHSDGFVMFDNDGPSQAVHYEDVSESEEGIKVSHYGNEYLAFDHDSLVFTSFFSDPSIGLNEKHVCDISHLKCEVK